MACRSLGYIVWLRCFRWNSGERRRERKKKETTRLAGQLGRHLDTHTRRESRVILAKVCFCKVYYLDYLIAIIGHIIGKVLILVLLVYNLTASESGAVSTPYFNHCWECCGEKIAISSCIKLRLLYTSTYYNFILNRSLFISFLEIVARW